MISGEVGSEGGRLFMKVVFLDVDGVLNTETPTKEQGASGTLIDEDKVSLLQGITGPTGASVVLHSGWRSWLGERMEPLRPESQLLVELLQKYHIPLGGKTPDLTTREIRRLKRFSQVKGEEILLWLAMHPETDRYVILEDLDLHREELRPFHVRIDPSVGLTPMDVLRAVEILTQEPT